jgi:hypothetical protein
MFSVTNAACRECAGVFQQFLQESYLSRVRLQVYRTLVAARIPVPQHIAVERDGLAPGACV